MKDKTLKEFVKHKANKDNLCFYYEIYPNEVKEMLNNIFKMCWRIGLYASQTLMMLDESLKPFKYRKLEILKEEKDYIREMFDL